MTEQTVFVVDDDAGVRDSLQLLLTLRGLRVETFASGELFLARCDAECRGCVLLDLKMPGVGGLEVQQMLQAKAVNLPVVIVTAHGDVASARSALKAGAIDFLEKPLDDDILFDVIRRAFAHEVQSREAGRQRDALQSKLERLTMRERQVMQLAAQGMHNRDIGAQLGISPRTVEIYKARMMEKLQANSLAEVIRIVLQSQLAEGASAAPGKLV